MWLTTIIYKQPLVIKMNGTKSEQPKDTPNGLSYSTKNSEDDESHQMISSLFLGPHAENYEYFKSNVIAILEYTRDARLNYFPEDGVRCHPPFRLLFLFDQCFRFASMSFFRLSRSAIHMLNYNIFALDSVLSVSKCKLHLHSPNRRTRLAMLSRKLPSCSASTPCPGGLLGTPHICVWT